jgi:hypothetical protein
MAIEIVDLPIYPLKMVTFHSYDCKRLPEGKTWKRMEHIAKTIKNFILSIIYSLEVGTYWIEFIDPYSLEVWNT